MSPNSDTSGRAVAPRPPDVDSLTAICAAHAPIPANGHFPSGTTFGDWRLTAFIGRGGNGEVYCAEHASLGTPAAVKVLMREDERAKARFTREAKLLANLKSDAFPRFYAYGEANGHPYLAMELLEPGELPTGERAIARLSRPLPSPSYPTSDSSRMSNLQTFKLSNLQTLQTPSAASVRPATARRNNSNAARQRSHPTSTRSACWPTAASTAIHRARGRASSSAPRHQSPRSAIPPSPRSPGQSVNAIAHGM